MNTLKIAFQIQKNLKQSNQYVMFSRYWLLLSEHEIVLTGWEMMIIFMLVQNKSRYALSHDSDSINLFFSGSFCKAFSPKVHNCKYHKMLYSVQSIRIPQFPLSYDKVFCCTFYLWSIWATLDIWEKYQLQNSLKTDTSKGQGCTDN